MPVKIETKPRNANGDGPGILLFDIETTPMKGWFWGCFKEYIGPAQIEKPSELLCFSAKWLGEKTVFFDSRKNEKDDKRLCKVLWNLVDRANVVSAHNGQGFDCSVLNARWAKWNMPEPSPYKVVDTYQIAKKRFRFPSNKLDGIARYLGIGRKLEHEGFDLWLKCMANDSAAWKRMQEYNIQDTLLLEEVYLRLRIFDRQHPNIGLMVGDGKVRCVCCAHDKLRAIAGKAAYTSVGKYPAFRCLKCGKVMHQRHRESQKGWGDEHVTNA